jgi:murein DD-endopeptidase MepM/ murein hydrolase activator NlpD
VTDVKDDSSEGGDDTKFSKAECQNYITIKHSNGEHSQYVHLAQNSSLVKKGDKVKKGQVIAKGVGMIGYTTFPHLHFEVFDENEKSLEINFEGNSFEIYTNKSFHDEVLEDGKVKPKYKQLIAECEKLMERAR